MQNFASSADFVVVGGGSAGCAVAAGLVERGAGEVLLVEAGPRDTGPLVKMPFGLVWLMHGRRDWKYVSAPQAALGGRTLRVPRGRMLGGSGSINSMVWFRGRADDFDTWNATGWAWRDVEPAFEEIERLMPPVPIGGPHPLTRAFAGLFGNKGDGVPTPESESAGPFRHNMRGGRRWSAADAFLRPAIKRGLAVSTGKAVARITFKNGRARSVVLADGAVITARKGVVLTAGAIGSPELLLRSGIGPADDLDACGIEPLIDVSGIGANLHDHPACGIHYAGQGSGYGITPAQLPAWAWAPFAFALGRNSRFGSPTVEAGAFYNARGAGGPPDIQTHFIPFMLGWTQRWSNAGAGYFADAGVCRPKSRGQLRITPEGLSIDFGLLSDPDDLELLVDGWLRLRTLMEQAPFGARLAREAYPGPSVATRDEVRSHIRAHAATAYHPVGTLRMGDDRHAPVSGRLSLRGVEGLWVADASIMPAITSANTNAPSIMIGHRAGEFIAVDAR